ncbi:unnamed protein product [Xylocopa violacea]|uniref:ABC transporter domain-containing protein n=1 Tax=Xylocopa violacea TaxID=135666 RepID=A0ABP1ND32_XYLVO
MVDTIRMKQSVQYPTLRASMAKDLCLTWRNISYTVEKKTNGGSLGAIFGLQRTEFVQLLNEVSGVVSSGMLMAIVGPSGAGKTTLLATISRRVKGKATGDVLLNGKPIDTGQMIRISAFAPQTDLAVESLTVQEHMEFMACMKMDRRLRAYTRRQRILALLEEFGLKKCAGTKLSTLSGGERKRVTLAVQLLTEPSILFCDEPTTGLDSYGAMTVVRTLKDVATSGRIVVCSLHQPASGLLDVFHEILLLSGGRVAFQGSSTNATEFFNSLDLHCPPTFNSAEFYVSQLSIVRGKEAETYRKVKWICDEYEKSKYGQRVSKLIESSCATTSCMDDLPVIFLEVSSYLGFKKARTVTQLQWLMWRTYVDFKRNIMSNLLRFVTYLFIGLLISSPYVNIIGQTMNQGGIQNMQGLLYLVVIETVFIFNYSAFYTFPGELPLLLRDIASGLYGPTIYYISKTIVLMPGTIIQPLMFSAFIFTITGLKGGFLGFVYFTLPVIACAMSATALGLFISASFKSVETASLFSVPVDFLGLMFCGIFLHLGLFSGSGRAVHFHRAGSAGEIWLLTESLHHGYNRSSGNFLGQPFGGFPGNQAKESKGTCLLIDYNFFNLYHRNIYIIPFLQNFSRKAHNVA